ncbi:hypothetical protein Tco_1026576, partial [Tanacetum coccineum]
EGHYYFNQERLNNNDENILSDPDEALQLGKSMNLTEAEEQEEARRVHETHKRSSEGVGITPEVLDEPKGSSATHDKSDESELGSKREVEILSSDDERTESDKEKADKTSNERTKSEKDDQEMGDAKKIDAEKAEEEKDDKEQTGDD